MPTIKDIAKAAGVSHGTVSNVLNKRGCVSYEKIRLVEETARAMGYAIDEKASTLRRGKARAIALLLPTLDESRYADLYTGVLRCAQQQDYAVRLFLTDDLPYLERRAIEDTLALKVSGVMTVSCLCEEADYAALRARSTPVLFLERPTRSGESPSYIFDMEAAADALSAMAAGSAGAQDGACVLCGDSAFPDQQTFVQALSSRVSLKKERVLPCARGQLSPAVGELTALSPLPGTVFCTSEAIAQRIRAAFSQSACLPQLYTLTSLRTICCRDYACAALNYRQMGHEAACAMIDCVENAAPLSSRVYAPSRRLPAAQAGQSAQAAAVRIRRPLRILAHQTPSSDALRLLLPRFEQQTGIPVELHACSMNDVISIFNTPGAGSWDVLRIDPSRLASLAGRILQPLDGIDAQAGSAFGRMLPGVEQEYALVDGRIYALPFDPGVQMLFYQKSLFENIGQIRAFYEQTGQALRVPESYEEFSRVSRFFSHADRPDSPVPYGSTLALSRPMLLAVEFLPRLMAAGELSYTSSGCLNLASGQALDALKEHLDFARYVNRKDAGSWGEIARGFISNRTATTVMFTNHSARFVHHQNRSTSMEIGFATIPGKHPVLGGASLAVGRDCAQPQEALAFIQWATSDTLAPEFAMLCGSSPCRCVYEQREILDTYPWMAQLPENIRLGVRRSILFRGSNAPAQYEAENVLSNHLLAALRGMESPQTALAETQKALERMAAGSFV